MPAKRSRPISAMSFAVNTTPLHLHKQSRRICALPPLPPLSPADNGGRNRNTVMRVEVPVTRLVGAAAGIMILLTNPAACGALSDGQKLVAEAWRIVDQSFVDRTFNHHDWFSIRMKTVKKQYPSVTDAYPAIRDMLSLLADPYTRFLTPQQLSSLTSSATGELAGVGVEMFPARVGDALKVAEPLDGSPAARAGIKPSDVIRYIDGESTDGLTPDEAAARIRGKPGTSVLLTVMHSDGGGKGKSTEETVRLTRENLKLRSVTIKTLRDNTLLVKIKQFNSTTADDLKAAISGYGSPFKRIILDLRNNPGGYFPGGVDVARLFMKTETPIVFVVDKNGISEEMDTVKDGDFSDVPLVVLVNKGTASASEILAGALKDNKRAKLVGEKTFGKGVVQTVSKLSDGSGVAVTIARYETPSHKNINKIGIMPDIASACGLDADVIACVPTDVW